MGQDFLEIQHVFCLGVITLDSDKMRKGGSSVYQPPPDPPPPDPPPDPPPPDPPPTDPTPSRTSHT